MENEKNLMDFNQAIRNISPNSRYMKPLISTISIASQQIRTVSDLSELNLDNNPFDEIFREAQLNNVIDDPFEEVFKASLKTNCVEYINTIESQTDLADIMGEMLENYRWDDASNNLDDVKINSLITDHQSLIALQQIDKSKGFKDQSSLISYDTFSSSELCCLNNEDRHIEHNSCVNTIKSDISNTDKTFIERCRTRAKSISLPTYADTDHKSMFQKCKNNSIHISYKVTGKSGITIDNGTYLNNFDQTELDETIFDEAHAIANYITQIDIEPTVNNERCVEELVSIEPLWSEELLDPDDIDDDKEHFISKQHNASSGEILNDIKNVLENSDVNEVDLHDILSTLCYRLKLNSEEDHIMPKQVRYKNIDDQVSLGKDPC